MGEDGKVMHYAKYGIGERIRALREPLGLSQAALAAEVKRVCGGKLSKQAVQSWEIGRTIPHYEAQLALGEIFSVSPCHIMFPAT